MQACLRHEGAENRSRKQAHNAVELAEIWQVLPPIEGGDALMQPLNMTPSNEEPVAE